MSNGTQKLYPGTDLVSFENFLKKWINLTLLKIPTKYFISDERIEMHSCL